ncbi:MAG: TIM barrel protein [Lentisphaeria bacterium]|nr:TIM barrel protein [Lentisphaeria bacterium]
MAFRVAVHLCGWPKDVVQDRGQVFDIARSAGYDGVEGVRVETAEDAVETAALAARYGLRLINVGASDPILKAKVNAALGNAAAEIPAARKSGGVDPDDAELDRLVDGLREPVAIFGRYGLRPFHHIHIGTILETAADCARVLQRLPELWLLLDTGHLRAAHSHPAEVLERWPQRIGHVHLKNFWTQDPAAGWDRRRKGFWTTSRFCDLDEGNTGLDIKAVLDALVAVGYDGWISVEEDHPRRPIAAVAQRNRQYLASLGY